MYSIFKRTMAMLLVLVTLCSLLLAGGGLHQEAEAAAYEYAQTAKSSVVIRKGPAKTYDVVRTITVMGTVLKIQAYTTNSSGNVWFQLSDGNWVFSDNVVKHNHSYTGGICNGIGCGYEWGYSISSLSGTYVAANPDGTKIWSRPYSHKSVHVKTLGVGATMTVTGQTTNQEGNVWYRLSDGNWVFSGNVLRRVTITYNANGGQNPPAAQYAASGRNVTLSSVKPTRVGYVFQGWATSASATSAAYKAGGGFGTKSNVTLYAVWKACSHSYSGGICDICGYEYPITVAAYKHEIIVTNSDGAKVWSRPYSNKSTHVRTEKKGAVLKTVAVTTNQAGNVWAKLSDGYWIYSENVARRFTVKYDANGGKGAPGNQYFCDGQSIALSRTVPTRVGYVFRGWATKSSSTTVNYAPGAKYSKQANLTLYAVWKACKHPGSTGGYCDDCGYELPLSVTAMSKTPFAVVNKDGAPVYNRPYSKKSTKLRTELCEKVLTVVGKTTNAEGNLWYQLSDGSWVYSGNVKQRYSVKYDANGGKNPPATRYFLKGQDITLSKAKPARVGYIFRGWATSASSTTVTYKPGAAYTSDKSLKLYAVWKKCTSHDYSGGICSKCKYEYPLTLTAYKAKLIVTNADGASIWNRPYSNNATKVRVDAAGKVLTAQAKAVNQAGNTWYQLSDGNWVYSGNVKRGYTVKFDANGGQNPPASMVVLKNAKVTVPSTKPTRAGYTFLGWSLSKTGSVEFKVGSTYAVPGNVTVYAVWAKNTAVTTNPASKNILAGKTASFTVKASGTGLKYQWQYRKNSGASWANCTSTSATTATLRFSATTSKDGYQYRCVIKDKYGNSDTSAVATLRVLGITAQPKTTYTKQGATAKTTVKATGKNLSYQWYIRNAGSDTYSKSSVKSATYSATMDSKAKDRRVYCVITDASGNKVQTETVLLRMAATVTAQPKTTYTRKGATASVKVKAVGDGLTYQWYYRNADESTYTKSSNRKSTYQPVMSAASKDRRVYCVITDKYGNKVQTQTVVIRMAATVTAQPKSVAVARGKTAKVTFKAEGDGLKYTWYYKNPGATKFTKTTTFTGNTYTISSMTADRSGRQIYCKVTDKYGNTVKTNTVTIKMK